MSLDVDPSSVVRWLWPWATPSTVVPGGKSGFPALGRPETGHRAVDLTTIIDSTLRYCRQMTADSDFSWKLYKLMHEPLLSVQDPDLDLSIPVQRRPKTVETLWQLYAKVTFLDLFPFMDCSRHRQNLVGFRAQVSNAVTIPLGCELLSGRIT